MHREEKERIRVKKISPSVDSVFWTDDLDPSWSAGGGEEANETQSLMG